MCPRRLTPSQCRSEKGEESSGRKASCPDPGFQTTPSVGKISPARQDNLLQAQIADSSSRNAISFSSARTTKRFPLPRCNGRKHNGNEKWQNCRSKVYQWIHTTCKGKKSGAFQKVKTFLLREPRIAWMPGKISPVCEAIRCKRRSLTMRASSMSLDSCRLHSRQERLRSKQAVISNKVRT